MSLHSSPSATRAVSGLGTAPSVLPLPEQRRSQTSRLILSENLNFAVKYNHLHSCPCNSSFNFFFLLTGRTPHPHAVLLWQHHLGPVGWGISFRDPRSHSLAGEEEGCPSWGGSRAQWSKLALVAIAKLKHVAIQTLLTPDYLTLRITIYTFTHIGMLIITEWYLYGYPHTQLDTNIHTNRYMCRYACTYN